MRKRLTYLLTLFVLISLAACQNNGHIGWIFGVWRVNEYLADGRSIDGQLIKTTTFAFQNDIVEVVALEDNQHSPIERFGTWAHEDDDFTLDFTHSDNSNTSGTGVYAAPEWLGMSSAEPMRMKVISHRGDKLDLEWIDADGVRKVYKLEKTW